MQLRFLEFSIKTNDLRSVREDKGMGEGISSKYYLGYIFHSKSSAEKNRFLSWV
jgi:hypothetical protein